MKLVNTMGTFAVSMSIVVACTTLGSDTSDPRLDAATQGASDGSTVSNGTVSTQDGAVPTSCKGVPKGTATPCAFCEVETVSSGPADAAGIFAFGLA